MSFIYEHHDEFGVEPICNTLRMAPSMYHDDEKRPLSARAMRDAVIMSIPLTLRTANRKVYAAHKRWEAGRRAGHDIDWVQAARLTRRLEIRGVAQLRKGRTTVRDEQITRPADLVGWDFTADRLDLLWVTDLTHVPTSQGVAYVFFIVDAFSRRIIGWRVAANMRTEMVLDALEIARWRRDTRLEGRLGVAFGCRVSIHQRPVWRTAR